MEKQNNRLLQTKAPVTLVTLKNPFDKTSKDIKRMDYRGESLLALRNSQFPAGVDVVVSVNGKVIPESELATTEVLAGDYILFTPALHGGGDSGKSILRIVAMIAVAIAAPYAAAYMLGYMAPGMGGVAAMMATTGSPFWGSVIAAGVMTAGSLVVNALLPPTAPKLPTRDGFESSQAYGWQPKTTQQQGSVIPKFYGVNRLYGNIISTYSDTVGGTDKAQDKQYTNVLINLGIGPYRRLYDFEINNQPVTAEHFRGVTIHARNGSLNQEVIPDFNDVKLEYPTSVKLSGGTATSGTVFTTENNNFDGLEVELLFPNGLWYSEDDGSLSPHTVNVRVEIKKQGDANWTTITEDVVDAIQISNPQRWSAGYWVYSSTDNKSHWKEVAQGSSEPHAHYEGQLYYSSPDYVEVRWKWMAPVESVVQQTVDYDVITGNTPTQRRYTYPAKNLPHGVYDIRVTSLTPDQTSSRYGDDVYLTKVREVYYDDFTYPRQALVGIRALANDQLSGSFNFSCMAEGSLVRCYDGSGWYLYPSSNPAWVSYDLLTQPVIPDNIIGDGEFEVWNSAGTALTYWNKTSNITLSRDASHTDHQRSLNLGLTMSTSGNAYIQTSWHDNNSTYKIDERIEPAKWSDKTITWRVRVYSTVAGRVKLQIYDDNGSGWQSSISSAHGGTGWEWVTVTRTLRSSLIGLLFRFNIYAGAVVHSQVFLQESYAHEGSVVDYVARYDGKSPAEIDLPKLKEWADFCDEQVSDGAEGTEKRATFNAGFDTEQSLWDCVLKVCAVGRAVPVWSGITVSVAIDKPASPVQLFSVGNIGEDSFTEHFLPMEDRATEIEVDYIDASKKYERNKLSVFDGASSGMNRASMELFGVTSQSEAWRAGMLRLNQNKYILRTVDVEVDIDAIACTIGDVVNIQHDIPQWGYGGRLVSCTNGEAEKIVNGGFELGVTSPFSFYVNPSASGSFSAVESASGYSGTHYGRVDIYSGGSTPVDIQLYYVNGPQSITAGRIYEVKCALRSDSARTVLVNIIKASSPWSSYTLSGDQTINVTTAWQEFSLFFTASITATDARLQIALGGQSIGVDIDDVSWGITTRLTLDREVTIEAGKDYAVLVRLSDDTVVERSITNTPGTYSVLEIPTPYAEAPAQYDVYSFGEVNKVVKPFKVIGIEKTQDQKCSLTLVEYNASIYNVDTDTPALPTLNYSALEPYPAVTGISLDELLIKSKDGTVTDVIDVTFQKPNSNMFSHVEIWYRAGNSEFMFWGISRGESVRISGVKENVQYQVVVVTVNTAGQKQSLAASPSATIETLGKLAPPSDVLAFLAIPTGDSILLSWGHILDADLDGYEIRLGGSAWEDATVISSRVAQDTFLWKPTQGGTLVFRIKAIDTSGIYSTNENTDSLIMVPPTTSSIRAEVVDNYAQLKWAGSAGTFPISYYEIRKGNDYATAEVLGNVYGTFVTRFETQSGTYRYWVTPIDTSGLAGTPASVTATVNQPPDFVLKADWDSGFTYGISNEFKETKDFKAGQFYDGWGVANIEKASSLGMNLAGSGMLVIACSGNSTANGASFTAPFAYMELMDDFEVETKLAYTNADEGTEWAMLLARDTAASSGEDFVALKLGYNSAPDYLRIRNNTDNVASDTNIGTCTDRQFKLIRAGSGMTFYTRPASGGSWTQRGSTIVRNDFKKNIQVGLAAATNNTSNNFAPRFEYFRIKNGFVRDYLTGKVHLLCNNMETVEEHFVNNSKTNTQGFIDAGCTNVLEPTLTTGYYSEMYDYGGVIPNSTVTLSIDKTQISGTLTITPTIYVSSDKVTWTEHPDAWQVLVSNFRYVRIRLDVSGAGAANLAEGILLDTELSLKLINDAGNNTVTDAMSGKVVSFTKSFIDVDSITVSPKGSGAKFATYDFVDVPNPISFTVYLFNASGQNVTGDFSWAAKGY